MLLAQGFSTICNFIQGPFIIAKQIVKLTFKDHHNITNLWDLKKKKQKHGLDFTTFITAFGFAWHDQVLRMLADMVDKIRHENNNKSQAGKRPISWRGRPCSWVPELLMWLVKVRGLNGGNSGQAAISFPCKSALSYCSYTWWKSGLLVEASIIGAGVRGSPRKLETKLCGLVHGVKPVKEEYWALSWHPLKYSLKDLQLQVKTLHKATKQKEKASFYRCSDKMGEFTGRQCSLSFHQEMSGIPGKPSLDEATANKENNCGGSTKKNTSLYTLISLYHSVCVCDAFILLHLRPYATDSGLFC